MCFSHVPFFFGLGSLRESRSAHLADWVCVCFIFPHYQERLREFAQKQPFHSLVLFGASRHGLLLAARAEPGTETKLAAAAIPPAAAATIQAGSGVNLRPAALA